MNQDKPTMKLIQVVSLFALLRGLAPQAKILSGMLLQGVCFSRSYTGRTRLIRTSKRPDAIEHG